MKKEMLRGKKKCMIAVEMHDLHLFILILKICQIERKNSTRMLF